MSDRRLAGHEKGYTDPVGFLARMSWMLVANVGFLVCFFTIIRHRQPFPSWLDLAFAGIVLFAVSMRWVDIRFFHGQTSSGAPATMAHFVRYAALVVVVGGLLLAGAHLLAAWVAV